MGLSLTLFGLPPAHYAPVAVAAEAAGYDGVWLADHVVTPTCRSTAYPYADDGDPGYDLTTPVADVWVTAAAVAAATSALRIGTGVYVLPLRPVEATARAAATVQALSDGRLLFGIGTGWLREEFDALGVEFEGRGRRTDDAIAQLLQRWGDAGGPSIPFVVGGAAEPALRRAAHVADGWYGPACPLEASVAARERIERHRSEARRTGDFAYHVRCVGPTEPATVRRYADAGFDDLTVALAPIGTLATDSLPETVARVGALIDRLLG
jgi:alkanesulfonate monooxygenase SsuD/methylene tetrahydromethanopterin reductase-like flavin-dependent oxidoreductase (luciferase family)